MPLMRIPYTAPLPDPTIYPASASTISGAIVSLYNFLTAPPQSSHDNGKTVLLTGAGISVASGLADYRGTAGTYTLNKTYRPIYFHEFCANHEARKRYWARSYLGWTNLNRARPNATHKAIARLGEMGQISSVITQSTSLSQDFGSPVANSSQTWTPSTLKRIPRYGLSSYMAIYEAQSVFPAAPNMIVSNSSPTSPTSTHPGPPSSQKCSNPGL